MPRNIQVWISVLILLGIGIACFVWWSNRSPADPQTSTIESSHEPFYFADEHDCNETPFRVDWPPREPSSESEGTPPLLRGRLIVSSGANSSKEGLNVRIELTRADSKRDRIRWNRELKFPNYDWMSRVRTWDSEKKWLWPNLPFLLRAHGREREQRYGGIDPGKGVDNDFAAIVIKSPRADQDQIKMITAEWHPPKNGRVNKHSIVHQALSGDLFWNLSNDRQQQGELGVWLIYADFLEFRPPASWPTEPEYDGGILAYFLIEWQKDESGQIKILEAKNSIPLNSTGVDWKTWRFNHP